MRTIARAPLYGALVALTISGCTETQREPTEPAGGDAAMAAARFSDWSIPVALPEPINSTYLDQQPSLSKDGLALYFTSNRPEHEQDLINDPNIWVATRACMECDWDAPVLLGPPVNGPANDGTPLLTRDGHVLYFFSNRAGQGNDIFTSRRTHVHGDDWSDPVRLGPGVNSPANESGPSLLVLDDESLTQLYFNRQVGPPGQPTGDIYVSELQDDGTWGVAAAVVELNDPAGGADQRPTLSQNGLEIYFWSSRSARGGVPGPGYIWHSTRASTSDPWGAPALAPDPINIRSAVQPFLYARGHTESLYFVHNNGVPGRVNLDIVMSTRSRKR